MRTVYIGIVIVIIVVFIFFIMDYNKKQKKRAEAIKFIRDSDAFKDTVSDDRIVSFYNSLTDREKQIYLSMVAYSKGVPETTNLEPAVNSMYAYLLRQYGYTKKEIDTVLLDIIFV